MGLDSLDDMSNHKAMHENTLTWSIVDEIAAELGVKQDARLKWRQRHVPPEWRIKVVQALMARGIAVSLNEFDALPRNPGRIAA